MVDFLEDLYQRAPEQELQLWPTRDAQALHAPCWHVSSHPSVRTQAAV